MTRADRVFVVISLLAIIFLMIMINLTTPSDVGPLGVLVFFTLAYLICIGVIAGLCRIFFGIRGKLKKEAQPDKKKSYYYASVLAFVPMILIFMRSFGEVNLWEMGLVALFAIVGCFYISKKV